MSFPSRKFKIEYVKPSKSGSNGLQWEEGYLIQSFHDGKAWVWLKNSNKVTIRKGSVGDIFIEKLKIGVSLVCAGYKIRILKESDDTLNVSSSKESCSLEKKVDLKNLDASVETKVPDNVGTDDSRQKAFLDPVLLRSMRPYQIEAASFLLNRLQDGPCVVSPSASSRSRSDVPITGAILADDMGTGKTLVGLSVIWALCRHSQGKGIIVCPSSLVQNWRKEINKWLPKTARTTIYISGGKGGGRVNDSSVHAFVSTPPSVHPLLVISYDMFRIYAEAFNTILTLNTLLCDEGHRLKNSVGTKTSLALGNCIAMQRLVLTGTPIQNNLDELYAVVNFTAPGYLGTLDDFQLNYATVIAAGNDPMATRDAVAKAEVARRDLSLELRNILIRRTGNTLLRDVLPLRREYIVIIPIVGSQKGKYMKTCQHLLGADAKFDDNEIDDLRVENTDNLSQKKDSLELKKRKHNSSIENMGIVDDTCDLPKSGVLPGLQRLRVICSSGDATVRVVENINDSYHKMARTDTEQQCRGQIRSQKSISDVVSSSLKIRVFQEILLCLKSKNQLKHDKIVVASNFIATLDVLEVIVRASGHQFLRIDGNTASEKRQCIVDTFNNESSPFTVCLISVKAGGVGLNLIGANRLILFEPDYNPATDQQAVGRVWRVGQKREVFIYRLVSESSIEESIVARQQHKNLLSSVIMEHGSSNDATGNCCESTSTTVSTSYNIALSCQTPGILRELILPSGNFPERKRSCQKESTDIESKSRHTQSIEHYDDIILNEIGGDFLLKHNIKVNAA